MRVIVVGAGLAGLTCVTALREHDAEGTVSEASDGVGSCMPTDEKGGSLLSGEKVAREVLG